MGTITKKDQLHGIAVRGDVNLGRKVIEAFNQLGARGIPCEYPWKSSGVCFYITAHNDYIQTGDYHTVRLYSGITILSAQEFLDRLV